ncbi:MAG: 50S ribosomal protein L11 [Candidatus Thermoplasmatota archaeon]|nr:50S ribosomal protein L11 [Candidatus Thermoplasmatota archaeon]
MTDVLEALVEGGKATLGPPLGPLLGPLGVNIPRIIEVINEKTKHFEGMKVPVKILIESDKSFEIEVGTPPTSALIFKELGIEKGSGKHKEAKAGNIGLEQVKKIAELKKEDLQGSSLEARVKEVIGSCISVGVTIEGKDPKLVLKEIAEGKIKVE